jgi:predicted RNase H-like HicB family nuclease
MKRTIQVAIRRGERKYVAECLELPIVTEASSLDELVRNIEDSVALFLKDEDLSELGLAERPVVLATLELEAAA